MPPPKLPRKPTRRPNPPSPWVAFLGKLGPGDCFVVGYPGANAVRAVARKLGIKLVWQREPRKVQPNGFRGRPYERMWRAE